MVESESENEGSGSDSEGKSQKSGVEVKDQKDEKMGDKKTPGQEKFTILKKPAAASKASSQASIDSNDTTLAASTATTSSSGSGNLIDFDSPESSSSTKDTKLTPSTSADSSPRLATKTAKAQTPTKDTAARSDSPSKAKAVFVPKGESKDQHLAAHASRQQSRSNKSSRRTEISEAEVKELDRQIQQATKTKASASTPSSASAGKALSEKAGEGLMASKHAPYTTCGEAAGARGSQGRNAKGIHGRGPHGLRVRRPLRAAEIPTNDRMAKAEEGVDSAGKKEDDE